MDSQGRTVQVRLYSNDRLKLLSDISLKVFFFNMVLYLCEVTMVVLAASMNKGRGVSETTERLANMSVGTRRQSMGQSRPPMKAGGVNWISESGNFMLRPAQQIPTGRTFTRKVAG